MHSDHSDGVVAPTEAVRLAHAAGLDTIALTDHDAVGGWADAAAEAARLGLTLVAGVEMTAALDGDELHLLAYFGRPAAVEATGAGSLRAFLGDVQAARKERIRAAVRALRKRGVLVSESDVFTGRAESYGRLHLARALRNAGYVRSENEAFSRHLAAARGAVGPIAVDPAAVMRVVHANGGLVFWAHPEPAAYARHIDRLAALGLDGVETHNFRRGDLVGVLTEPARGRGLLASGGSDWHGGERETPLGVNVVADAIAEPLLEALYRRAA